MDKKRRSVHIAEIKRKYKDKVYTAYLPPEPVQHRLGDVRH
ncbi:MAG: hypothetical protein Q8P50_15955 [Bacillota bacterium]|nr:hypothetical protein [Bacillota bacterium]